MQKKKVVVTGLGAVSPLGRDVAYTWKKLIAGCNAARAMIFPKFPDIACKIACPVPTKNNEEGFFCLKDWVSRKEIDRRDPFTIYAIAAAHQALQDASWNPTIEEDQWSTGVAIGSGIGGLQGVEKTISTMYQSGSVKYINPFFVPEHIANAPAGLVSIKHSLKGPNIAASTACSTSAHMVSDAARLIQNGEADVMVAGGTEASICPIGLAGFSACRALTTKYNDCPSEASRPFDTNHDGFVMGEGSAIIVLEELEHAKSRKAHIYAELIGYGLSADAYHIVAPHKTGDGALRAMRNALKNSSISADAIDYINAHGTSTPVGDEIELMAVEQLFEPQKRTKELFMSSTKSSIGHLLGAAGAMECLFCIKVLQTGWLPPTLNLHIPCRDNAINLVSQKARKKNVSYVMNNSFGFGGTNVSIIFKKYD